MQQLSGKADHGMAVARVQEFQLGGMQSGYVSQVYIISNAVAG
jgi:hypothetical protein